MSHFFINSTHALSLFVFVFKVESPNELELAGLKEEVVSMESTFVSKHDLAKLNSILSVISQTLKNI
jgi:hypothetical protein